MVVRLIQKFPPLSLFLLLKNKKRFTAHFFIFYKNVYHPFSFNHFIRCVQTVSSPRWYISWSLGSISDGFKCFTFFIGDLVRIDPFDVDSDIGCIFCFSQIGNPKTLFQFQRNRVCYFNHLQIIQPVGLAFSCSTLP